MGPRGATRVENGRRSMTARISAVINTFNEERNIAGCLQCLAGHVDEIVVSDMYSTDRTVELCRAYTDRIFFQTKTWVEPHGRERAVKEATHEWVLVLDADERVSPVLIDRLREIAGAGQANAVSIARINYLFGRRFTGCGFPSERFSRFFRKGCMQFGSKVHIWGTVEGRVEELPETDALAIHHYSHPTVYMFVEKMNAYTESEARHMAALGWQPSLRRLVLRPARIFCEHYFRHRGYRSGRAGLMLSLLMGFYWMLAAAKLWRFRAAGGVPEGQPL